MQLPSLIALVLSLTLTASAGSPVCGSKSMFLNDAIDKFRSRDFTVPSEYASTGIKYGAAYKSTMKVTGKCSPAQPVSKAVCVRQMTQVCEGGGPIGGGTRYFGRDGCQAWMIHPVRVKILPWLFDRRDGEEGLLDKRDEEGNVVMEL